MNLLWGIGGVIGVLAIAFLLSSNRKAINWRTIL
ncbi:Na+ dependent nucleoside transporter N-terminal domain-containing protein, partial [Bacillus sp. D-CC]